MLFKCQVVRRGERLHEPRADVVSRMLVFLPGVAEADNEFHNISVAVSLFSRYDRTLVEN